MFEVVGIEKAWRLMPMQVGYSDEVQANVLAMLALSGAQSIQEDGSLPLERSLQW